MGGGRNQRTDGIPTFTTAGHDESYPYEFLIYIMLAPVGSAFTVIAGLLASGKFQSDFPIIFSLDRLPYPRGLSRGRG
jgi:hypothetical protein